MLLNAHVSVAGFSKVKTLRRNSLQFGEIIGITQNNRNLKPLSINHLPRRVTDNKIGLINYFPMEIFEMKKLTYY